MIRNALAALVGCVLVLSACGKVELRVSPDATGPDASAGGSAPVDAAAAGDSGEPELTQNPIEPQRELGAECTSNADCGADGLKCLRADQDLSLDLGAVPGGVCTHTCVSDAQCQEFGSGAVCANLAEEPLALFLGAPSSAPRYCMPACTLGPPGGSSKCHGRQTAACRPFAPLHAVRCLTTKPECPDGLSCFRGYCREVACGPRCNGDQDCAAGRHCDPQSGLCTLHAVQETNLGTPCDTDLPDTSCASGGECLALFDDQRVKTGSLCTQSCVMGAPCANGQGACQMPRFDNYEVGDIGYCQPTCDCNAECQVPGDECVAWGNARAEQLYGSKGACMHANGGASLSDCGSASAPE